MRNCPRPRATLHHRLPSHRRPLRLAHCRPREPEWRSRRGSPLPAVALPSTDKFSSCQPPFGCAAAPVKETEFWKQICFTADRDSGHGSIRRGRRNPFSLSHDSCQIRLRQMIAGYTKTGRTAFAMASAVHRGSSLAEANRPEMPRSGLSAADVPDPFFEKGLRACN